MAFSAADERWMQAALHEATHAHQAGDVPIGAVAVWQSQIIGRGYNRREADADPTAHAEMIAMRQAARHLQSWRLDDVTLYCTLEPCCMCASTMVLGRLTRLVYAADDIKAGAGGSIMDLTRHPQLNHHVQVERGLFAAAASAQIQSFFKALRVNDIDNR